MGGHFRVAPWHSWVIVLLLEGCFGVLGYCPDSVPVDALGAFGAVLRFICYDYPVIPRAAFWILAIIHAGEAVYAGKLASEAGMSGKDTLCWMIQTFIVGFPSLILLNKTRKALKKKKPQ